MRKDKQCIKEIDVDEFEKLIDLWSKAYVLDDEFYQVAIKGISGYKISPENCYRFLIRFLELWGVRMSATKLDSIQLSNMLVKLKPDLEKLNESFITIDLEKHGPIIRHVFKELISMKHLGPTSASKILHLLNPKLFVMWDREIAKKYRVAQSPDGYVEFLKKMQSIANDLLNQFAKKYGVNDPETYLSQKYGGKTLAKLLDEYNWLSTRPWLDKLERAFKARP